MGVAGLGQGEGRRSIGWVVSSYDLRDLLLDLVIWPLSTVRAEPVQKGERWAAVVGAPAQSG